MLGIEARKWIKKWIKKWIRNPNSEQMRLLTNQALALAFH